MSSGGGGGLASDLSETQLFPVPGASGFAGGGQTGLAA